MPDPAFGEAGTMLAVHGRAVSLCGRMCFSPYFAGRVKEVVAVLFGRTTYGPERTLPGIGSVHSGPFASIVFCVHRPYF